MQLTHESIKHYQKDLNKIPERTILEEVGNSITHGIGVIIAIIMFIFMLINSSNTLQYISSFFYGISMIIMMCMSCLYHAFNANINVKKVFRRFDYASIYLLIGGTYAPILLLLTGDFVGHIIFIVQWVIIIIGITFIFIFGPGRFKWLHFPLYFIIGWGCAFFTPLFNESNNNFLFWIGLGGIIYTLGMIPFWIKNSKCAHFIWHLFVLLGFIFQWIGIFVNLY